MGGVGIRAMSRLMDRVMAHVDLNSRDALEETKAGTVTYFGPMPLDKWDME